MYVRDVKSSVVKADKELKGFVKVELAPGETKSVQIELNERAFSHYVEHLGKFAVESGEFQILVGASSRDIRLAETVVFTASEDVREPLTLLHSFQEWLKDDRNADKVSFIMSQMKIGADNPLYPIVLGLPIRNILNFLPSSGYPQEVVEQIYGVFGMVPAPQEICIGGLL